MNSMPEWFTAEPEAEDVIKDITSGGEFTHTGAQLNAGFPLTLAAGVEKQLLFRRK